MYCVSSNPALTNCAFIGNDANTGGGIYCSDSNPTLTNCTFSGNSASDYGGGIYSESSNAILTDSFLCGNFISGTSILSQIDGSYTDNGGNFINDVCPPPVTKIEGDNDGDGDVDFDDFAIFANNWLASVE
jgi:predicted outer membrane repeat protein